MYIGIYRNNLTKKSLHLRSNSEGSVLAWCHWASGLADDDSPFDVDVVVVAVAVVD